MYKKINKYTSRYTNVRYYFKCNVRFLFEILLFLLCQNINCIEIAYNFSPINYIQLKSKYIFHLLIDLWICTQGVVSVVPKTNKVDWMTDTNTR